MKMFFEFFWIYYYRLKCWNTCAQVSDMLIRIRIKMYFYRIFLIRTSSSLMFSLLSNGCPIFSKRLNTSAHVSAVLLYWSVSINFLSKCFIIGFFQVCPMFQKKKKKKKPEWISLLPEYYVYTSTSTINK